MFVTLILLVLLGWGVHFWRSPEPTRERSGTLLLLWVLVGYCGIPMLAVAGLLLIHPHEMAHILGVNPPPPMRTSWAGRIWGWP